MWALTTTWTWPKLQGRPYELIGVTATTPLIQEAWEMAAYAKQRGLITVLGGPHLTIMPLESLKPPHNEYVDYVFKGEAEYSFLHLVNTLEAGQLPDVLPGIHFRHGEEIVSSPESPMIPELDALPFPAHDLFKIDRYTNLQPLTDGLDPHARSFTILTSRGCSVQMHLLLQAGHRRHLACTQRRRRRTGMEVAGEGSARHRNRRHR